MRNLPKFSSTKSSPYIYSILRIRRYTSTITIKLRTDFTINAHDLIQNAGQTQMCQKPGQTCVTWTNCGSNNLYDLTNFQPQFQLYSVRSPNLNVPTLKIPMAREHKIQCQTPQLKVSHITYPFGPKYVATTAWASIEQLILSSEPID